VGRKQVSRHFLALPRGGLARPASHLPTNGVRREWTTGVPHPGMSALETRRCRARAFRLQGVPRCLLEFGVLGNRRETAPRKDVRNGAHRAGSESCGATMRAAASTGANGRGAAPQLYPPTQSAATGVGCQQGLATCHRRSSSTALSCPHEPSLERATWSQSFHSRKIALPAPPAGL